MRDPNAMEISQSELNAVSFEIRTIMDQYTSGLITIQEFLNALLRLKQATDNINLCGLIDPNTGLKYPTLEEIAAIDARLSS